MKITNMPEKHSLLLRQPPMISLVYSYYFHFTTICLFWSNSGATWTHHTLNQIRAVATWRDHQNSALQNFKLNGNERFFLKSRHLTWWKICRKNKTSNRALQPNHFYNGLNASKVFVLNEHCLYNIGLLCFLFQVGQTDGTSQHHCK